MSTVSAQPQHELYQAVIDLFSSNKIDFIGKVTQRLKHETGSNFWVTTLVFGKEESALVIVLRHLVYIYSSPTSETEDESIWEGRLYWWPNSMDEYDLVRPLKKTFWSSSRPFSIFFENEGKFSAEDIVMPVVAWFTENQSDLAKRIPSFDASVLPPENFFNARRGFWKSFALKRFRSCVDWLINAPIQ